MLNSNLVNTDDSTTDDSSIRMFSALFVALVAQDGFEKRGGDARFATGVMGSSFNRIGDHRFVFYKFLLSFRESLVWFGRFTQFFPTSNHVWSVISNNLMLQDSFMQYDRLHIESFLSVIYI